VRDGTPGQRYFGRVFAPTVKEWTELQSSLGNMRQVATVAVLGTCLFMQGACSSPPAVNQRGGDPPGADAGWYDVPIRGAQANSADALVSMTAGPATFSPDGPSYERETHVPVHDGSVEHRMGGTLDLINGCTFAHFWVFPDEAFSTYCGDIAGACEFVCGTPEGCSVLPNNGGSPQETYCPAVTGSGD